MEAAKAARAKLDNLHAEAIAEAESIWQAVLTAPDADEAAHHRQSLSDLETLMAMIFARPPIDTFSSGGEDKEMETRIATLEDDMGTVKTALEVIRATMVTKDDLDVALRPILSDIAGLKAKFDAEIPHLATKALVQEIKSDARTWIVGMGITLLVAFAGIQIQFFNIVKSTIAEQMAELRAATQAAKPPSAPPPALGAPQASAPKPLP